MRIATLSASLMALLLAFAVAAERADAADDAAHAPASSIKHQTPRRESDGGLVRATRCMAACHDRGGGREGCLQSCARRAERVVNAPAISTLERLSACIDDCYSDTSLRRTDRETCKLTCSQIAALSGPDER